jgi:hypothetical protein
VFRTFGSAATLFSRIKQTNAVIVLMCGQWRLCEGEFMVVNQNAGAAPRLKSLPPRIPQLSQDQQFEDGRQIAERLIQAFREAGYSCELGEDGHARALKREN